MLEIPLSVCQSLAVKWYGKKQRRDKNHRRYHDDLFQFTAGV